MKKVFIVFVAVFLMLPITVKAEEYKNEDFLKNQAELAGADKLNDALPEESREYFEENDIIPWESDWVGKINIGNVFKKIWNTLKVKITTPFISMGLITAVILVSGTLSVNQSSISSATALFAVTAASSAVVVGPLLNVINTSVEVMQSVAIFMTSFIPTFAVIVAANGQTATSVTMSGLLLSASQIVELISSHFVIPLMCGYLSVSVASGVSPLLSNTSFNEILKKLSFWIMSLVTTIFLGVLSIQTTINSSADSLAIRTARFVLGSSVPVAGTALSEALTTVTASLGILKTSVAIYGVVACCIIFLPVLAELLLWRFSLNVTAVIAEILSVETISRLLKNIDTTISVLCGIILLSMALFVISLSVVISVGRV